MSATRPPELGNTAREMRANTGPVPEVDYAWTKFLSALSYLLDPLADVTRPPDDSGRWTVLASPARCPDAWLPVLAQWAGVRRPDTMDDDELRALIGPTSPGMWRGTRAGLLAAARRFLPEGANLYWEEFADGDAYHFRVFTFNTEPEVEAQIREALLHAKPAGLFPFTYEVRVGQTWAMLRDCGPTWWQVKQAYANWFEVMHQEPEVCRDVPDMPEPSNPPLAVIPDELPSDLVQDAAFVNLFELRLSSPGLAELDWTTCRVVLEGFPGLGTPTSAFASSSPNDTWWVTFRGVAAVEAGMAKVYPVDVDTGDPVGNLAGTVEWTEPYFIDEVVPVTMSRATAEDGFDLELHGQFPGNLGSNVQIAGLGNRETDNVERIDSTLIVAHFPPTPPPQNGVATVRLLVRGLLSSSLEVVALTPTAPMTWTA